MTSPNPEGNAQARQHGKQSHNHCSGSTRFLKLQRRTKTLLTRLVVLVVYITSGAALFHLLESDNLDEEHFCHSKEVSKVETELVTKFNVSIKEVRDIVQHLCIQFEKSHKCKYSHNDWSYYQSLYFVGSVTTTIGYGHLAPKTQYGRLFLIFYAFFGIPINLLALQSVGEHINLGFHNVIALYEKKLYKASRVRHEHIKTFVLSIILMILMLPIGGLMYYFSEKDEGWTYLDSVYYSFVAMSTIGFGDLVPNDGKEPRSTYERVMWFIRLLFLVLGLSLVSSVFTSVSSASKQIKAAYMNRKGKYMINSKQKSSTEHTSFTQAGWRRFKHFLCSANVERTPSRQNTTTNIREVYSRFEDTLSSTSLPSQANGNVPPNHVTHSHEVDLRYRSISMALSQASLGCEYSLDAHLAMSDREANTEDDRIATDLHYDDIDTRDIDHSTHTSTELSKGNSNEPTSVKEMTQSTTSEDDVTDMNTSSSCCHVSTNPVVVKVAS